MGTVSKEQIEMMVQNAEKHYAEDEYVRKKMEARKSLEIYVYDMRNIVEKLNVPEKEKDEKEIVETMEWIAMDLGNVDEYEDKLKELRAMWDPIIANCLTAPQA